MHRQLISLNKRYTGRQDPEFNLRHDWNSLLHTDVAPVTNRTKLRFPNADVLVEYLADFAREQEQAGRIWYNSSVERIARSGKTALRPPATWARNTQTGTLWKRRLRFCSLPVCLSLHSPYM